jgi:hypothetical protein
MFTDGHRERFGVEPICRTLGVSASAYYHRATGVRSARQREGERLVRRIREIHHANYEAYGYRRTWKALLRAGEGVPRCRVQRRMRAHGKVWSEPVTGTGEKPVLLVFLEADDGGRTRDLRLGKPTLYQLSYVRVSGDSKRPRGPAGTGG